MTKLSSATYEVVRAAHAVDWVNTKALAAALRIVADQVVPIFEDPEFFPGNCCERVLKQEQEEIRSQIFSIVNELESQ